MRLLGNTILVEPMPDAGIQTSASGILLVNHYKKANLKYRVLEVGPGEWRKRKLRSGKIRTVKVWDKPECEVGDCILCRAELDGEAVKHSLDDGTGRLIIYGHAVMMVWKEAA